MKTKSMNRRNANEHATKRNPNENRRHESNDTCHL